MTAGMPVGSGQILSLVDALAAVDLYRHEDAYYAARASVVTRPEQRPIFDREFSRFWRELLGAKPAPLPGFVPQSAPSESLPRTRPRKRRNSARLQIRRRKIAISFTSVKATTIRMAKRSSRPHPTT